MRFLSARHSSDTPRFIGGVYFTSASRDTLVSFVHRTLSSSSSSSVRRVQIISISLHGEDDAKTTSLKDRACASRKFGKLLVAPPRRSVVSLRPRLDSRSSRYRRAVSRVERADQSVHIFTERRRVTKSCVATGERKFPHAANAERGREKSR